MPDPIVVLIEDEPQIRRFLRATLAGQGYRLFEASTGADGLVEVGSRQPDVVIVDGIVNGVGHTLEGVSALLRLFQTGFVGTYALFFTLGVAALLLHFLRHMP